MVLYCSIYLQIEALSRLNKLGKQKALLIGKRREIHLNRVTGLKKNHTAEFNPEDGLLTRNSDFAVVEAYKSIRTNIMYSIPKSESGKVIVLTSAAAGEGKTTTCINLAMTFAMMNAKVLLIDCDLRKPRIHRYLKLEKKDGLSNVLCGFSELHQAIKTNVRDNLDVIIAGDTPPNPAELLQTAEFEKVITVLKKAYDYIIIDTPPINIVTDATSVIRYSSGVVFLIKKNHTTYDMVDASMEQFKKIGANVIGSVVVDDRSGNGHSGYKNYKSYKYGYREDISSKFKK